MEKLTILVTSVNAVGHINSCSGALQVALHRGHRIIFVLDQTFKGKLAPLGYEEFVYEKEQSIEEQNSEFNKITGDFSSYEKFNSTKELMHCESNYREFALMDAKIKEAIGKFKPDLIYFDGVLLYPSVFYSGIPWVNNLSVHPLCFLYEEGREDIVPGCSGYPSNSEPEKFREFNKIRKIFFRSSKFNDFIQKLGYDRYPLDAISSDSPNLTVYAYPDELNYSYIRDRNWFNLEVFNKVPIKGLKLEELVPREFLDLTFDEKYSEKLIYVSMGTIGSVDLDLMKRLVEVLGKTNHKYIFSKGPRHSEYELAPNMHGDQYLPQTALIPHVDLVITHGGNNSFTEVFAQGKPMIVLPIFVDQFDNAQRVHEMGFGVRLDTYNFTEQEICGAIERLLDDMDLISKLKIVSKRIAGVDRHEQLADELEKLVLKL